MPGVNILIMVVISAVAVGALGVSIALLLSLRRAREQAKLTALVADVQSRFLNNGDSKAAFYRLLEIMLELTDSHYGYIAEVKRNADDQPYLKTHALWDTSWPPEVCNYYMEYGVEGGMEFHNTNNILSSVLRREGVVFINNPEDCQRECCTSDIDSINTFVGLPVYVEQRLVAVVGLANRLTGYDVAQARAVAPLLVTVGQVLDNCVVKAQQEETGAKIEAMSALVSGSNDAVVLIENGIFIDCNPATEALFLCDRSVIVGSSLLQFSPEFQTDGRESKDAAQQSIRRVLKGEPQCFMWQHLRPNGDVFSVEISLNRVAALDGREVSSGVLRDVTEREQLQKEIQEHKSQLELTLESTAAGIWDWNLKTQRVTFNSRWAEIMGYTLAELEPISLETWRAAYHPEDYDASQAALENCWQGKTENYIHEARMRHKNGAWIWVLDTGKVVEYDSDGKPLRMVGTHLDIDHIKKSEQRAESASAQLTNFFELSQDFMCVTNVNGHFEKVNRTFSRVLGYSEQELLHQPFFNFIHPDDYDATMNELHSLAAGNCSTRFRNRFQTCQGHYLILQWNLTPDPLSSRIYATAIDVTEKEKSEQELRTLSRIAKEVNNGVVITDKYGVIEWVNEAFEAMSGYAKEDVVGRKPKDFLQGSETSQKIVLMMQEELLACRPFKAELVNYSKSGAAYWVDINCSPMFDDTGCLQGFMAIQTDITEQKSNVLELERQRSLLEQMSEIGRIGAWEFDLLTKEIYWSPITRNIHQVDDDFKPTLDNSVNFYKEGESRNAIIRAVETAIESGEGWALELQLTTAVGREIWVSSTGKSIFSDGRCVKVFGSFQDVDERKRHQLTHQQSVRHNQALAGLTLHPDVLSGELDRAARTILKHCVDALSVSRVSIWLFEAEYTELKCLALYDTRGDAFSSGMVLLKTDYPEYFNYLSKFSILSAGDASTHSGSFEFNENYLKPNNIVSMLDAVISDGQGFTGVICIENVHERRDWSTAEEAFVGTITTVVSSVVEREQRRKTEFELITAIDAAKSAAQAKSDFLTSMSHEIRTPMNGVLGMLSLILKTKLDVEQQRKVNIALSSAHSLLAIINDILDFSKIDAGKVVIESAPFNLNTLLSEISETMAFKAEEQQLGLVLDITGVTTPHVLGDSGRLRQIFTNLVGNALKFTHQGEITITAETVADGDAGIWFLGHVTDTGIGIAAEKQIDLFDAFTQVDTSNTRQYGGTGLGLSIVKKLCEVMGGMVWLESVLGGGSCFSFKVLLQKNIASEMVLPSINLKGLKVLVVDDDSINRDILAGQLKQWGMLTYFAASASEAMVLCAEYSDRGVFDIALLDMQMPGINGATLGKTLKEDKRYQHMPLIMMTSQAQRGDAEELSALGFSGYLCKPVSASILRDAMTVILDGSLLPYAAPLVTHHFLKNVVSIDESPPLSVFWPEQSRVLLVEDNVSNREVGLDLLQDIGLVADVAIDGQEALKALLKASGSSAYQLVLMDCQMPNMDGFEATKAIRQGQAGEENSNIFIVAMTASALKGDRERCLEAGMNDYLSKPVNPDELNAVLHQWLSVGAVNVEAEGPKLPSGASCDSAALTPLVGEVVHFSTDNVVSIESAEAHTIPPILPQLDAAVEELQAAVWDLEGALKRVRGRPGRLLSLIHSYSEQSPEMISDLYQKIESNDLAEAATLCHTLRGVAGNLGGVQLITTAQDLETCCHNHDHDEAERLVGELLLSNNDFLTAIQRYQQ